MNEVSKKNSELFLTNSKNNVYDNQAIINIFSLLIMKIQQILIISKNNYNNNYINQKMNRISIHISVKNKFVIVKLYGNRKYSKLY